MCRVRLAVAERERVPVPIAHGINHAVGIAIAIELADAKLGEHCESGAQLDAHNFADGLASA